MREAERLAERRRYAEAVRTLELAMIAGDSSETLLRDLAGYYRKVGDLRRATGLLKPLADRARPRPWHLLEVAGMLVDQGKFTEAEGYLARFEELKPKDPRADRLRRRAAERLSIVHLYPGARLDTFAHNTAADDNFPHLTPDGSLLWASDRAGDGKRLSGWTGRAMVALYCAVPDETGGWQAPQRLPLRRNAGRVNVASPWMHGDTLYFSANGEAVDRAGDLPMQLYASARDGEDGGFAPGVRIGSQSAGALNLHPAVSPDGQWLYFASTAPSGFGGLDLYVCRRRADGGWGRPDNLGSAVNTERHDGFPVAAADGRLYFASQGHVGLGGFDLYVTERGPDGVWSAPRNLGEPVNGPGDETCWLPVAPRRAYLVSDRVGGDDDIYEVRW